MRKIKSHTCLKVLFNFAFFFEIPDLPFVLKKETSSTLVPIVHFLFSDKMENHRYPKVLFQISLWVIKKRKTDMHWRAIEGSFQTRCKVTPKNN